MFFRKSRAKQRKAKQASGGRQRSRSGPSLLSQDLVIDGSVSTGGELQIAGTINGSVRARAVVDRCCDVSDGRALSVMSPGCGTIVLVSSLMIFCGFFKRRSTIRQLFVVFRSFNLLKPLVGALVLGCHRGPG